MIAGICITLAAYLKVTCRIYNFYNMAYGGGGFSISYPLAKALESM
jgi:hypothetical protein